MTWIFHVRELRLRLLLCLVCFAVFFGLAFWCADDLRHIAARPLIKAGISSGFIYTGIAGAFVAEMQLAMFVALCCSMPVILWQIYMFVRPALYSRERAILMITFITITILFFTGIAFCYIAILPWACQFFASFQDSQQNLLPSVSEYIGLFINCMLTFGMIFQMPIALIALMCIGILNHIILKKARRFVIVAIFILSAIITPPDIISQIALALPTIILYEAAIFIGSILRP